MDFQSIRYSHHLKKTVFFSVLILKIFYGGGGDSSFYSVAQKSFLPFIHYFLNSGFKNPYHHFLELGQSAAFPYPAMMLYITAIPQWLLGFLAPGSLWWSIFLFKIPLLCADLGIFYILRNWLRGKEGKVIVLYWLSPVLAYISYFYGQLDVIPICLLFIGLYFLFREQFFLSAVFMGLSVATKTHILLCYPFLFLYLLKKTHWRWIVFFFVITMVVFLSVNIAYIMDKSFLQMVFCNDEQSKIFQLTVRMGQFSFYLIPAGLLLLFIKGVTLKTYNRDIFIMFLGFAFSIILFFIAPQPGWYFWIIPFFVYFYICEESGFLWLFWFFQAAALIYLMTLKSFVPDSFWGSMIFTLLQSLLLLNCLLIYRRGLNSYTRHKITSEPFLIGIGGNSGVGKTFLTTALIQVFQEHNTLILRGDDHHKWQRNDHNWQNFTHLDPKANHLHHEVVTLKKLKKMQKIRRRTYNHDTGCFTEENILEPKSIIILEGLHPFYVKAQRDLYDLKIFIAPEINLEQHWKIVRDRKERGHSDEKILEQMKKREEDRQRFIITQKQYADILINIVPHKEIQNIGNELENPDPYFIIQLNNSVFIDPIVEVLSQRKDVHIEHQYEQDDKQKISIQGHITGKDIADLSKILIPGLQDIGIDNAYWPEGSFGVVLLFIVYCIFEEADHEA